MTPLQGRCLSWHPGRQHLRNHSAWLLAVLSAPAAQAPALRKFIIQSHLYVLKTQWRGFHRQHLYRSLGLMLACSMSGAIRGLFYPAWCCNKVFNHVQTLDHVDKLISLAPQFRNDLLCIRCMTLGRRQTSGHAFKSTLQAKQKEI